MRIERTFAASMRGLRRAAGLSQTSLAKKLSKGSQEFHQTTVSRIESGDRTVTLDEAYHIAAFFGTDVHRMTGHEPGLWSELQTQRVLHLVGGIDHAVEYLTKIADELREEAS